MKTEGVFKKGRCLTRPAQARQDVPFLGQGRSMAYRVPDGATVVVPKRSVQGVREHDKGATCLREAASAKAGNPAGGLFQRSLS
ncbi:MAG: hypothetical protein V3U07_02240 [Nitrospirales bacterium]